MGDLHITKVAVGCTSVEDLSARIAARAENGSVTIFTRYRPTRFEDLIGGSLFWIIRHSLAVRQQIIAFEEATEGKRWIIRLDAQLVPVHPRPKRAHQGWRYLKAADAPIDLEGGAADLSAMPQKMLGELAALSLI